MKKWLPHEILTSRVGEGHFNDFSTLKISLYTPANKVVEVYWFHNGCLIVWHLVFPSVNKLCLYNNSSSIQWWYFTYMLTLTRGGPLLILGQKVKGHIWTLNIFNVSAPQLHFLLAYNNGALQMYWPWPEKDLYCFWGQRIKGQGHIWSLNFVSCPHDDSIYFWLTIIILHRCIGNDLRLLSIFRSKVKVKFGL